MSTKHASLPWVVRDADSPSIATADNKNAVCTTYGIYGTREEKFANAAAIVRAVNAHEALIKALERIVNAARALPFRPGEGTQFFIEVPTAAIDAARDAIRAAKGES